MQVLLFCPKTMCSLFRGNCVFSRKEQLGSLLPLQPLLHQLSLFAIEGQSWPWKLTLNVKLYV